MNLETFKKSEAAEQVVPLVDDPELRNLVSIWPNLDVEVTSRRKSFGSWSEVWRGVFVDTEDLADILGTPLGITERLFARARAAQLIYPDGSINEFARKYLASLIRPIPTVRFLNRTDGKDAGGRKERLVEFRGEQDEGTAALIERLAKDDGAFRGIEIDDDVELNSRKKQTLPKSSSQNGESNDRMNGPPNNALKTSRSRKKRKR